MTPPTHFKPAPDQPIDEKAFEDFPMDNEELRIAREKLEQKKGSRFIKIRKNTPVYEMVGESTRFSAKIHNLHPDEKKVFEDPYELYKIFRKCQHDYKATEIRVIMMYLPNAFSH